MHGLSPMIANALYELQSVIDALSLLQFLASQSKKRA